MIASARSETSRFELYAHVRPINRENTSSSGEAKWFD